MRKYGIKSLILTMLNMTRRKLVTNKKVKAAAEGKLKHDREWLIYEGSINDELEKFLIDLRNQEKIRKLFVVKLEVSQSYFTPKLTIEEMKLVQDRNEEYLKTFMSSDPDVHVEEMKRSDSKSKFVHASCFRITMLLNLEDIDAENKTENLNPKRKRKYHNY